MDPTCAVFMLLGGLGLIALVLYMQHQVMLAMSRHLSAFLRSLDEGRSQTEVRLGVPLLHTYVRGRLEGHPIALTFEQRGAGESAVDVAIFEVEVDNPAGDFRLQRASPMDQLARWAGLLPRSELPPELDDDLVVRHGDTASLRRLFQQVELVRAIRHLMNRFDVHEVQLEQGTLRVERRVAVGLSGQHTLHPDELRAVFRALFRVARLVSRQRVTVKVAERRLEPRFAWTGGGSSARCPYCRDEVDVEAADEAVVACGRCGTLHHRDCLDEAGGCTIFGCGAERVRARA